MGILRTAATRSGLVLGTKLYVAASASKRRDQKQKEMMINTLSSNFSQFMRRRSSTLAAAAATRDVSKMKWESKAAPESKSESESEFDKEKTLYLNFSEVNQCGNVEYSNQVIRPIKLRRVLSTTATTTTNDDDAVEELGEAAYKRSRLNIDYSNCSRLGSLILLAGGQRNNGDRFVVNREILWFDTRDPNPKFEVSSSSRKRKSKIKSFRTGKDVVRLGEVDGKLYCIGDNPGLSPRETFEVFDPTDEDDDPKWWPMDAPPPFLFDEDYLFTAKFVAGSNKILGWKYDEPQVFCFDVSRPEKGWDRVTLLFWKLPSIS